MLTVETVRSNTLAITNTRARTISQVDFLDNGDSVNAERCVYWTCLDFSFPLKSIEIMLRFRLFFLTNSSRKIAPGGVSVRVYTTVRGILVGPKTIFFPNIDRTMEFGHESMTTHCGGKVFLGYQN